jgi:phosphate butyryltransferase
MGIGENVEIIHAESPEQAIQKSIALVREGKADILQKGLVQTADLMRAILHKENGICSSGVLAHVSLLEIPGHHKLVALTDSALLTYPTIEQKVEMIRHAVALMQAIGTEVPKVAILAAVETVNPKMPETVEAAELKKMWERKEITGCIVEGPISYDLAMDPSSSRIKNYQSPVGGDADILIVPDIQAGNILIKALLYSAKAISSGMIMGASVPVLVSSRSASIEVRSNAVAVAAALGRLQP